MRLNPGPPHRGIASPAARPASLHCLRRLLAPSRLRHGSACFLPPEAGFRGIVPGHTSLLRPALLGGTPCRCLNGHTPPTYG